MSTQPPEISRTMERHIQTVLAAILIGLVGWVGLTVTGNREQISRVEERLSFMSETIRELKTELSRRGDIVAQIPQLLVKTERLETRVEQLEKRIIEEMGQGR